MTSLLSPVPLTVVPSCLKPQGRKSPKQRQPEERGAHFPLPDRSPVEQGALYHTEEAPSTPLLAECFVRDGVRERF